MAANAEFCVYGNYGEMTVSLETGQVIIYCPDEGEEPAYDDIERFDIPAFEVATRYRINPGDSVDIVYFGFWSHDGRYFEPDPFDSDSKESVSDLHVPHIIESVS